mgnify:CR=1 FL=1
MCFYVIPKMKTILDEINSKLETAAEKVLLSPYYNEEAEDQRR